MRRAILALSLALLAACETSAPSLGDAVPDPGPTDVPGDPGPTDVPADIHPDSSPGDVPPADLPPTDVPGFDVPPSDTPADAPADILPDASPDAAPPADVPTDAPADVPTDACLPVACDLFCPHGYRTDAAGCEQCACRECESAKDCGTVLAACAAPTCGTDGMCRCDCTGVEPRTYDCPDGTAVPWCACGPRGRDCLDRPDDLCPTLCTPGVSGRLPCADGSDVAWCECTRDACTPECREVGTPDEGWYDSCSGKALALRPCAGCHAACQSIGTRSEGWYDDCEAGGLIEWAFCGAIRTCADSAGAACQATGCTVSMPPAPFACPDGATVAHCRCAVPAAACPPVCQAVGSKSEGWYDSCSGALIGWAKCDGCTASCDAIGSKSEGWYSSCTGLIAWAQCGSGDWTCTADPWSACTGHAAACVGEGGTTNGPAGAPCCPGLESIEASLWDGDQCLAPNCLCGVCTYCGDGVCVPPENRCNCPSDCLPGTPPLPRGAPCQVSDECQDEFICVLAAGGAGSGVCTDICYPMSGTSGPLCPDGFTCVTLPDHQAPGFCLQDCAAAPACPSPLTCGANTAMGDWPDTCFDWGAYTAP